MNRRPTLLILLLPCILCAAICFAVCGRGKMPTACFGTQAPKQAVTGFFDSVCLGNFGTADNYLCDYSSLGLDGSPATAFEQKLFEALKSSYSYQLSGEIQEDAETGGYTQAVELTHLNVNALSAEMNERTQYYIGELTANLPNEEIYGDNDEYKPEIVEQALENALDELLADKQRFYVTDKLDISLKNTSNKWCIVMSDELENAILGRTGDAE